MPYDNIPGVRGTYLDGAFRVPTGSAQPQILVLGTSPTGLTNEKFNVTNVRQSENEFGAASELMKGVHEAVAQNADNLSVMRVGGRQGNLVITDSLAATVTITPEYRDDTILANYALVIEQVSGANRFLVFDLVDETWVYDSSEILVLDTGIVELVDTGLGLFTLGDKNDPTAAIPLSTLLLGDLTAVGAVTCTAVTATAGADGTNMSLVERYAALNTAYHLLDFKDADFVVAQGTYIDDQNVVDGDTTNFFKGVPVLAAGNDSLGYAWQKIYQGKLYTYFVDSPTYFADETGAVAATVTTQTDLVLTADKTGTGGNSIDIAVNAGGAAGPTVTITEPTDTSLLISVEDDGTAATSATVTAINLALGLFTMANGQLASTLVTASGGGATLLSTLASDPLLTGAGGHVLTHNDLTGDTIPAAVSTAFAAGSDAETREVNFAHQLASFCYLASTTWKTIVGSIGFHGPSALSRPTVASWMGNLPTYTTIGLDVAIDAPADNGTGILGNRFLAGWAETSNGYRAAKVTEGDVTDGYGYGGLILTTGTSLPDGTKWPYGIDDSDEALDLNKAPIDIGKHILVTYDWPVHRNAYNGGANYRGQLNVTLVGKLATMSEKEEPIGSNGVVLKVTSPPRVHSAQQDDAASIRAVGLRRDTVDGYIIVSSRTAAHPDSDYTRISTIRSVNRTLQGIRKIGKPHIGKEFSTQRLVSLQAAIDGFLKSETELGYNGGAQASISFSRSDKIMGKLTVKVRMVPPFSIESITVETSLAAEASDL